MLRVRDTRGLYIREFPLRSSTRIDVHPSFEVEPEENLRLAKAYQRAIAG